MYFKTIFTLSFAVAGVVAAPFNFPTPDGFPNVTSALVAQIYKAAGGTLPNRPPLPALESTAITTLQLLAHNELSEVAFLTQLLANITNDVPGYRIAGSNRASVIKSLNAIVAQDKVHLLGANTLLQAAGQAPIAPCTYVFPVNSFQSAMVRAQAFTDLTLGTLPEAQLALARDGGQQIPLIQLLSAILGQKGEQVGFFRYVTHKTASSAPQLTEGDLNFSFTALQRNIVPNSCPKPLSDIPLKTFGKLEVITNPEARNMTLIFEAAGPVDPKSNEVAYISGLSFPYIVPITEAKYENGVTRFKAEFPFDLGFNNGLTIAAVINKTHPKFESSTDVAKATVYGPGLIEVD